LAIEELFREFAPQTISHQTYTFEIPQGLPDAEELAVNNLGSLLKRLNA
jgi:hypothetical protein